MSKTSRWIGEKEFLMLVNSNSDTAYCCYSPIRGNNKHMFCGNKVLKSPNTEIGSYRCNVCRDKQGGKTFKIGVSGKYEIESIDKGVYTGEQPTEKEDPLVAFFKILGTISQDREVRDRLTGK